MNQDRELWRRLRMVVARRLGVKESRVTHTARFMEDLGVDSMDGVELIMALEDEFGLEISNGQAERLPTAGDALEFIMEAVGRREQLK